MTRRLEGEKGPSQESMPKAKESKGDQKYQESVT